MNLRPNPVPRISRNPGNVIHAGLETRTAADRYDWHGLKRGGDPSRPSVLFQHTLSGRGEYREGSGAPVRVAPGMAFCAIIPSDHRYRLPTGWPPWTFRWAIVSHPYVVARIVELRKSLPAAITLDGDGGALAGRLARLLDGAHGLLRDEIAVEQAIFDFLFEYERAALAILHPAEDRERLLSWVRERIISNLQRRCDVEELAAGQSMSRSHFAHHFKTVTGQSPAHYITIVRLEEAIALMAAADQTLEAVAARTGFANANHLCKVFRRHFHMSPGQYRREILGARIG
ncbi:MAG: AraC family transcriptional regulator [Capsulimonadaceae bacterium]|nr:AraC family transcriptional regulator [Capsulimonadaceae bacterium]